MKFLEWKPFDVDQHLPIITEWANKRNFPAPSKEFLPPTGILLSWQGKPIAAAFLFKTDANVACIAHLFSDPDADKDIRQEAVKVAIDFLTQSARYMGFKMVTMSTNIVSLGERIEKMNFEKTDENVSHFRRFICPSQD